jgi:hypothetical protein
MKPSFMIAGVAKCGTTSLYYYLEQHPEICIPKKETFYFIARNYQQQTKNKIGQRDPSRIIRTPEQYEQLYSKCGKGITGEVSTCYVYYYKEAIPLIKQMLGDIPIVIIIRQPVERVISGYKHFLRLEKETLPLKEALSAEDQRLKEGYDFMWQYRGLGFYADAIEAYQKNFSRVKIILQEDLQEHTAATMKEVFRFIGADETFVPDTSVQYNISDPQTGNFWFKFIVNNRFVKPLLAPVIKSVISEEKRRKLVHKLRRKSTAPPFKPEPELVKELHTLYRNDILRTQELIGRDLSSWLQPKP